MNDSRREGTDEQTWEEVRENKKLREEEKERQKHEGTRK